jgi:hypothetical protein
LPLRDESGYWLELVVEAGVVGVRSVERLAEEAEELTRIFAASRETAKANAKTRGAKRLIT